MRSKILLLVLILFLGLVFTSSGFGDMYIVKDETGKIVAITNQNIFKAEYQKLDYTFELWFKTTERTPSLDDLIKSWASEITEEEGKIKILDWTNYLDGNYYYVEGILKNVGRSRVKYVQVKAIAYDSSKKLVTLKESYANPYDLAPGQEATFRVMIKYNSRIKNFELRVNWED